MRALACAVPLALTLLASSRTWADGSAALDVRARLYDVVQHAQSLFVVGHPGLLLRSTDRGEHFREVLRESRDPLLSIDINHAGIGAVVGRRGLLLLTRDGGTSWTRVDLRSVLAEGERPPHLFAVDVLDGGQIVAVGDFGVILHSADQGKSWERRRYAVHAPESERQPQARAASKRARGKSARGGPSEVGGQRGLLDQEAHANADVEQEAHLSAVSFGSDRRGFIVGEFGLILVSDDRGLTWTRQESGVETTLFSVHALSADHAVAVGGDGVVLETRDGRRWSRLETPTKKHLFGVWMSHDTTLAVGADGVALLRAPGAQRFELVPTHVHGWLSAATLLDAKHGIAVGAAGRVLSTTDNGRSFRSMKE